MNSYRPESFTHPGTTLKELMVEHNCNSTVLSKKLNITETELNNILDGNSQVTVAIAFALEDIFKVSSQYWLNYQQMFNKYIQ